MLPLRGGSSMRWAHVPELIVLTTVMEFQDPPTQAYRATSEQLSDVDIERLADDLREALAVLTGDTFTEFAAVRREEVPDGTRVGIRREGQIVVGRYRGVRERSNGIGLGGALVRGGRIVGGSIMLDDEFDRTSDRRRLLRAHELGHALGYRHVESRVSIMNTRIGAEATPVDREIARLVFRGGFDDPVDLSSGDGTRAIARVSPDTGRLSARQ